MTETCSNCRFHSVMPWTTETGSGDNHFCLFDPPEFVPPNGSQLKPVQPAGWCGKWQPEKSATVSVPAPVSDPNTERSSNLSVRDKRKGRASLKAYAE